MNIKFLLVGLVLVGILSASESKASDAPDPLNSYVDRPAKCKLKQGERDWLMNAMKRGELRLATEADKRTWETLAKKKKRPNTKLYLDCGRTYTILKLLKIPDLSGNITFIVPKGVSFPIVNGGTPVYDINTGGGYQSGSYDDGEKTGTGRYPSDPSNPSWQFRDLTSH